jgi:para-aminobenzoate synthetase/4-amino-4-deoxychorismate lyase
MNLPGGPFVLFEDAREGAGPGRLFAAPHETIVARTLAEAEPALERLRAGLQRGYHAAGWLSYEAGIAFEQRLIERAQRADAHRFPLLWFGLFEAPLRPAPDRIAGALPDEAGAWLSPPRPRMTRAQYDEAFTRAKDYIAAGDIYQVNLSYRADLTLHGDPLAAYARLRRAGQGGWSGAVFDGSNWLLSTSPELCFRLSDGSLEARPMKGTAKRHDDAEEDRAAAAALRRDPKELAENVMIVDLLRNDLSRLAKRGSVRVPELFAVETYPTLHTLTSTIRADLKDGYDAVDCLRALFPCGSITGAPKIRAMEIISELETDLRGPYTGSIGWISPDGEAEFNVAIRTVGIAEGRAEVGLGSAVVFDSTAEGEWVECVTKSAFLTRGAQAFDLLETMRLAPAGIAFLDAHLRRLERSARAFGFLFDEAGIRTRLAAETTDTACILRLALSSDGALALARRPLPTRPSTAAGVVLAPRVLSPDDFRLHHKTSLRDFYDEPRIASGAYEVVFIDQAGFVTEGSFTNVFVKRGGVLITPPAARGLLPGILRQSLLESGEAVEGELRVEDLADGFFIGNAARGMIAASILSPAQVSAAPRLAV